MVMKYQFMYVYEVRRDAGGTWWPKVFNLLMIGVGFFQVITLATVFTANFKSNTRQKQFAAIAPLPFVTGALWFACISFIAPKAQFISKKDIPTDARPLSPGSANEEMLEDKALNPVFVKPLMKVWVWKRSQHLLPALHTPTYSSLDDYLRKHPEAASGSREKRRKLRLFAQEHNHTLKKDRKQMKARAALMAGNTQELSKFEADDSGPSGDVPQHFAASKVQVVGDAEGVEDELPPEEMVDDDVASRVSEDSRGVSPDSVLQGFYGGSGQPPVPQGRGYGGVQQQQYQQQQYQQQQYQGQYGQQQQYGNNRY
ncbi:hypothetical protein HDU97_008409 [Phlyctochytrium planicorne]|nr:hypothetical protein HDU97_008409 [Phlyctochytrium planicorne]